MIKICSILAWKLCEDKNESRFLFVTAGSITKIVEIAELMLTSIAVNNSVNIWLEMGKVDKHSYLLLRLTLVALLPL